MNTGQTIFGKNNTGEITTGNLPDPVNADLLGARYRLMFESAHDAILLMDRDVFIECNPKTLEIFGCTRDQIVGKTPVDFSPEFQPGGRLSAELAIEWIESSLTGKNQTFEWTHTRSDGTQFEAEVSLNSLQFEGSRILQASVRDVSSRHRLTERLQRLSDCMLSFTADPGYNLNRLIALCGEFFGASFVLYYRKCDHNLELAAQWNVPEGFEPEASSLENYCREIMDKEMHDVQVLNNLRDCPCSKNNLNILQFGLNSCMGKVVRVDKNPVGMIRAVFRDNYHPDDHEKQFLSLIANAIGVEEERRIYQDQLMQYANDLKMMNEAKNKFFSIISHDLKGPFNAIMGFSDILTTEWDDYSDEERRHFIRNIYNSATNTFRLVENLLEWARTQTGQSQINPVLIDLSVLANEMVIQLREMAERKQIKLYPAINFNTMVYADENMLKTVLRNLLTNAIKFTMPGGMVSVSSRSMTEPEVDKAMVEVSVHDNGIGIPQEILSRLFVIGEKVSRPGTSQEKGTGLGLIICREFLEKNGGTIHAQSEEGKGSRFYFRLPEREGK
jgi:PAS domain S-box-containing protein